MQEQLEEQLVVLQNKVKKLALSRDQLIRDEGAAQRKLEEAQEKLRELGIETEGLTSKQLQAKAEALESELGEKLVTLATKVEEGEQLVAKYQSAKAI
jgi:hypothetical protein